MQFDNLWTVIVLSGILGGIVNFFSLYFKLPKQQSSSFAAEFQYPWWIYALGFIITGIGGAFLIPILDSLVSIESLPFSQNSDDELGEYTVYIVAGYCIVAAYFSDVLLKSIFTRISGTLSPDDNSRFISTSSTSGFAASDTLVPLELKVDEYYPARPETEVVGKLKMKITRNSPEFAQLIKNDNPFIIFKDEEGTGADPMMSKRLYDCCNTLAEYVFNSWDGRKLRITEAWDENNEHSLGSLHYEGRAVDLTIDDKDRKKLGKLGGLAIRAGFDWVLFEKNHIHASVGHG